MNETIEMFLANAETRRKTAEKEYSLNTTTETRHIISRLGSIYYMLDALYEQNKAIIAQNEKRSGEK